MFKKIALSSVLGLLLGLVLTYTVPQANAAVGAIFDTINRGYFVTTGAYNMTVGAAGTGSVSLVSDGVTKTRYTTGGSLFNPVSNPANTVAATTVAGSGTIDSTIYWQRVTNAGAISSIVLEAGTENGQFVYVTVDKDAVGSVTFAAEASSNVCSGTSAVIAAGEGALFIWDATDTCWVELGT